jgi:hypothetical protein
MTKIKWMLPLVLAGLVIASGFGFVKYYNGYEGPGEHWAPESPIAHESARFATDMGEAGDFAVTVEKLSSKASLFFVEYQTPGKVLDMVVHSDDGIVRLAEQFTDEGKYRITVQHTIHPEHKEIIDFTVQTPLAKYTNDVLLFMFLLAAGFLSGSRLRALTMVMLVFTVGGLSAPEQAMAHGVGGETQAVSFEQQSGDVTLAWLSGKAPVGEANRTPMDWRLQLSKVGKSVGNVPFTLDFVHSETHFPVLHIEGVANHGVINLKYSPPDGTDYELQVSTVIDGKVYHLGLPGSAEAIRPTAERKWKSFLLMMVPFLMGIVWGWRRKKA